MNDAFKKCLNLLFMKGCEPCIYKITVLKCKTMLDVWFRSWLKSIFLWFCKTLLQVYELYCRYHQGTTNTELRGSLCWFAVKCLYLYHSFRLICDLRGPGTDWGNGSGMLPENGEVLGRVIDFFYPQSGKHWKTLACILNSNESS